MIIDHEKKLIFICPPKTGTTSLRNALKDQPGVEIFRGPLRHMQFKECLSVVKKEKLSDYETCAVIRHPVDKLISWFQYRSRPQLAGKPRYVGDMSFKEFVKSHEGDFKKYSDKRFVEHEEQECSLIFKYENFGLFLNFFNFHYPNKELRHLNQSEKRQISEADKTLAYSELHEEIKWYETIQTQ
jgi:hypothetical protein